MRVVYGLAATALLAFAIFEGAKHGWIATAAIVVGAIVFAMGIGATRAMQRWLENQFLPTTTLDPGLRNSITTAAGYIGYIAAAAITVSISAASASGLVIHSP